MRTALNDLNELIFQQIEAISNPDLGGDQLKDELEKSKVITGLSGRSIEIAKVQLEAIKVRSEYGLQEVPRLLE